MGYMGRLESKLKKLKFILLESQALPDGFFGFDDVDDTQTEPKNNLKISNKIQRDSIVKIKSTKWKVFRRYSDFTLYAFKHPSKERKMYEIIIVGKNKYEVWELNGEKKRIKSKFEITGDLSLVENEELKTYRDILLEGSGKEWARKNYKGWDVSRTDKGFENNLAVKAQRLSEMAKKKIQKMYGVVKDPKAPLRLGVKTNKILSAKDQASVKFWEEVSDEAMKIWNEEVDKIERKG